MQQPDTKPSWMDAENNRAKNQTKAGTTTNATAPKLARVKPRAPDRKQKAFYIQEKHASAFEALAFEMRKSGMKAPELAEQAIELLLKKHGKKL